MIFVYRYGLKAPTHNAASVREQMYRAHCYRNNLVAVARGIRAVQRDLIDGVPDVVVATGHALARRAAVIAAHAAIKAQHVDGRARKHSAVADAALAVARKDYIDALEALETARRAAERSAPVRAEFARIAELADGVLAPGETRRRGGLRKSLRAQCGAWWGTYLLVEDAMDRSLRLVYAPGKSIALPKWDGLDPRDPRFVRWNESTQAVGASNNKGPTGKSDEFVRIVDGQLSLKIGADEWARWPIALHRPVPSDARITACRVQVRREGPGEQWEVLLTLDTHETRTRTDLGHRGQRDECGDGRVAVDIGWRVIGDEIRVACWRNSRGETGEIRLDATLIAQLRRPAEIRSARESLFNQAKLALGWFIASLTDPPAWLPRLHDLLGTPAGRHAQDSDDQGHIDAQGRVVKKDGATGWRSPDRLVRLCLGWREKRFAGDEVICQLLDDWSAGPYDAAAHKWRGHDESWRRRDKHLWHMEAAMREKAIARRNDLYRVIAAGLARTHGELVLESFNLNNVTRVPTVESCDDDEGSRSARSNRQLVAVSELRGSLIHALAARGGQTIEVDPAESTHECPVCHVVTEFDAAASITWECSGCGHQWDQDHSAAWILLQRGERGRGRGFGDGGGGAPGGDAATGAGDKPAPRETKWARKAREKREREARAAAETEPARSASDAEGQ